MGSKRTRNLNKLLARLNQVEYYMCPSFDEPGKGFHATSIELFPAEITCFKYLIRREIIARAREHHQQLRRATSTNVIDIKRGTVTAAWMTLTTLTNICVTFPALGVTT